MSEASYDLGELGEGGTRTTGTIAPTPIIPDHLTPSAIPPDAAVESNANSPATIATPSPSTGCNAASSAPDLWMIGLLTGMILFGVRERGATRICRLAPISVQRTGLRKGRKQRGSPSDHRPGKENQVSMAAHVYSTAGYMM